MEEIRLSSVMAGQLAALYAEMERCYAEVAARLGFSCAGCPDNCCDSYFQHHTYVEWAYLWEGLRALPAEELEEIQARAAWYIQQSERMLRLNKRPDGMCPLNKSGLCSLYAHRFMICRLHGVPATLSWPDGKFLEFPGCFRCQEIGKARTDLAPLERAGLYQELAALEMRLLGRRRSVVPKVKLTLAQMLIYGPPRLP
jgi:hypothetical protein